MKFKFKFDIKDLLINYLTKNYKAKYDFTYPNQKYTLNDIIDGILWILKTGMSYRDYSKISGKIHFNALNTHMLFMVKNDVFKQLYVKLLNDYIKRNRTSKLKYQLIDTTYINNQYGVQNLGRNKFYKNKKGYKVSCISDVNGIPLSILVNSGNMSDSKFIENHLNAMLIVTKAQSYTHHNRYKQYILADAGYDTLNFRNTCKNAGYIPIVDYNKRNTKNITKVKKLTNSEKLKYKKRLKIENMFSWFKKNKRVKELYEKSVDTYLSFVYLAFTKLLINRI